MKYKLPFFEYIRTVEVDITNFFTTKESTDVVLDSITTIESTATVIDTEISISTEIEFNNDNDFSNFQLGEWSKTISSISDLILYVFLFNFFFSIRFYFLSIFFTSILCSITCHDQWMRYPYP